MLTRLLKRKNMLYLIFISLCFIIGFSAYHLGKADGKKEFYETAGRIVYIKSENVEMVKALFEKDLLNATTLDGNDPKKLYAYKIYSVTPNVILDIDGTKYVCYDILYDIQTSNIETKERPITGKMYWMAPSGKVQLNGWVTQNHRNFELLTDTNGNKYLKLHGEG